jgi:hypothetical protein
LIIHVTKQAVVQRRWFPAVARPLLLLLISLAHAGEPALLPLLLLGLSQVGEAGTTRQDTRLPRSSTTSCCCCRPGLRQLLLLRLLVWLQDLVLLMLLLDAACLPVVFYIIASISIHNVISSCSCMCLIHITPAALAAC